MRDYIKSLNDVLEKIKTEIRNENAEKRIEIEYQDKVIKKETLEKLKNLEKRKAEAESKRNALVIEDRPKKYCFVAVIWSVFVFIGLFWIFMIEEIVFGLVFLGLGLLMVFICLHKYTTLCNNKKDYDEWTDIICSIENEISQVKARISQ